MNWMARAVAASLTCYTGCGEPDDLTGGSNREAGDFDAADSDASEGDRDADTDSGPCSVGRDAASGSCLNPGVCSLDCSNHGECQAGICTCDLGHAGASCADCAAGWHRVTDGDGACTQSLCAGSTVCSDTQTCNPSRVRILCGGMKFHDFDRLRGLTPGRSG